MKISEVTSMVAAALETGYLRGHKTASKDAASKFKTSMKIQRQMTIQVIEELWGPTASLAFVERMDERERAVGGEILGSMAEVFEKLGLDPADVNKLRKVFEEQTETGRITGFELPLDPEDQEERTSPGTGEEMHGIEVPEGMAAVLTVHPDGSSEAHLEPIESDEPDAVPT